MTAVLIENRPLPNLNEIIDRHLNFLPNWDFIHLKPPVKNAHDYNKLLTNPNFWKQFKTEYVLIFQHDSGLLKEGIDEFINLDYDYYGAPWKDNAPWARKDRAAGNGGLSLRKVKPHIKVCTEKAYNYNMGNEDVYFSHNLPNVAPYEVCKKFSVETEYQLGTLGYHAIDKHLTKDQVDNILHFNN